MRKRKLLVATGFSVVLAAMVYMPVAIGADGGSAQGPAKFKVTPQSAGKVTAVDAGQGPYTYPTVECNYNAESNPYVISAIRSTSVPLIYQYNAWQHVMCGDLTIFVPKGKTALIVATTTAELDCYGLPNSWCQGRIIIDGVEGYPRAPEPDSFAWAHSEQSQNHWEANSLQRSRIYTCPSQYPSATCPVRITTEVRQHDNGLSLWVDDLSLSVVATIKNP